MGNILRGPWKRIQTRAIQRKRKRDYWTATRPKEARKKRAGMIAAMMGALSGSVAGIHGATYVGKLSQELASEARTNERNQTHWKKQIEESKAESMQKKQARKKPLLAKMPDFLQKNKHVQMLELEDLEQIVDYAKEVREQALNALIKSLPEPICHANPYWVKWFYEGIKHPKSAVYQQLRKAGIPAKVIPKLKASVVLGKEVNAWKQVKPYVKHEEDITAIGDYFHTKYLREVVQPAVEKDPNLRAQMEQIERDHFKRHLRTYYSIEVE